ncbi:MAG: peptide chain release factor N(5)-glutamine methyltransferase [Caldilineales bacterium]
MAHSFAMQQIHPAKNRDWTALASAGPLNSMHSLSSQPPLQTFIWHLAADATVVLALVAATQRLSSARVETPKLDSEVLLAAVLGCNRAQLYAYPERLLSAEERSRFEHLVVRRFQHEPVAYLVGEKAFYGLDFYVDRRVLIPRPETELLVDLLLDVILQQDEDTSPSAPRLVVADIGAGSGAVSVAVAANTQKTLVYAIDISADALAVARSNAARHRLQQRIHFLHGNLLEPLPEQADVIVANLPYVASHEWQDLAPGIVNYEPTQALLGGSDGLDSIRGLLQQAPVHLKPGGVVLLEVGSSQGAAVAEAARAGFPNALIEVLTDYAFRERIVRIQT